MNQSQPQPDNCLSRAAGSETSGVDVSGIVPLAEMERAYVMKVISLCAGNIPRSARALDISPSTLYRKLAGWEGASRRAQKQRG
jgi:two-component system, repressor protein LuxO